MTPTLLFRDSQRRPALEPLCQKVVASFQLSDRSLICIFDDEERSEFVESPYLGPTFCGFFAPVRECGKGPMPWPQQILDHIWKPYGIGHGWAADALIYLRSRTCESVFGAAITFAHELTHFKQYGLQYKAWQAERRIREIYTGAPIAPWLLPTEHEAQLSSRKVADAIFGKDQVAAYAKDQAERGVDPNKWEFFLAIDTQQPFNLFERVDVWVREYKTTLVEHFPKEREEDPDFTKPIWWE